MILNVDINTLTLGPIPFGLKMGKSPSVPGSRADNGDNICFKHSAGVISINFPAKVQGRLSES